MASTVRLLSNEPTPLSLRALLAVGLIRWKIVIHAFIDGFSRFVLGILASTNNRASTVLQLFEDISHVFGYPSRVRGDHGTENLLVAAKMEEVRGVGRGSYICGRSAFLVHGQINGTDV